MTTAVTLFGLKEEMSREMENVVNRLNRHCKIGKVAKKVQIHGGQWVAPNSLLPGTIRLPPSPFISGGYVHTASSGDVPIVPHHGTMM